MEISFYTQFEKYSQDKELFYANKLRTSELFQLFNQEIENTKLITSSELEDFLFSTARPFDFYTELLKIIFHNSFGSIKKLDQGVRKLFKKLIKIKKYHKVLEALEILENNKIYHKEFSHYKTYSDFHLGNVEKGRKYSSTILESIDFNEIINNYNIYLKNSFVLSQFLSKREVYSLEVILEALIRSITEITLDDILLKSLSSLALDIPSSKIAEALIDVLESQGQSFGINIDELREVKDEDIRESDILKEKTVYDYRYPLYDFYKMNINTDYSLDKYEKAKILKENEDYIGALALYREVLHESTIDENLYKNLTYEIAVCYEKMGDVGIAKKLYEHIQRRYPGFRLVKERLTDFEQS